MGPKRWIGLRLKHERAEINAAARVLLKNGSLPEEEQEWASDIVNNWRYAHNYPLNTFKVTLRKYVREESLRRRNSC